MCDTDTTGTLWIPDLDTSLYKAYRVLFFYLFYFNLVTPFNPCDLA